MVLIVVYCLCWLRVDCCLCLVYIGVAAIGGIVFVVGCDWCCLLLLLLVVMLFWCCLASAVCCLLLWFLGAVDTHW